jgi:hypothetical protein
MDNSTSVANIPTSRALCAKTRAYESGSIPFTYGLYNESNLCYESKTMQFQFRIIVVLFIINHNATRLAGMPIIDVVYWSPHHKEKLYIFHKHC